MITQTYRVRESTALRLGKLLVSYKRASGKTKWAEFFAHVVELLEAADPNPTGSVAQEWPGGLVLTARQQRIAEAQLVARYPHLMLSRSFKEAFRGVQHCPPGPERAWLLEGLIVDLKEHEVGQQQDVDQEVRRAAMRQILKWELQKELGKAQWFDRGRPLGARKEYEDSLDPQYTKPELTYGTLLEMAGAVENRERIDGASPKQLAAPVEPAKVPIGNVGDPSPDGSEEALQAALDADAEARAMPDVPLEQDPEYIAWRKRTFGDPSPGPEGAAP